MVALHAYYCSILLSIVSTQWSGAVATIVLTQWSGTVVIILCQAATGNETGIATLNTKHLSDVDGYYLTDVSFQLHTHIHNA